MFITITSVTAAMCKQQSLFTVKDILNVIFQHSKVLQKLPVFSYNIYIEIEPQGENLSCAFLLLL